MKLPKFKSDIKFDPNEPQTALKKIVSGGQTGVDRAALDAALFFQFPCGGWCPKGRKAEDGAISSKYPLKETPSDDYKQRTEWNARDSDATLILSWGKPSGGTALTIDLAIKHEKDFLVVDLEKTTKPKEVIPWLVQNQCEILNIAGPRLSKVPQIDKVTFLFVLDLLTAIQR